MRVGSRIVVLMGSMFAYATFAAEKETVQGATIQAMEGLPAVSFVVPWQASRPGAFIDLPPRGVLDDYLQPLDSALLPGAQTMGRDGAALPPRTE